MSQEKWTGFDRQRPLSLKGAGIQNNLRSMTPPPKNEKESGSYFFNYFEYLLLSEIEADVCQSQLIFLDSPFSLLKLSLNIFSFSVRHWKFPMLLIFLVSNISKQHIWVKCMILHFLFVFILKLNIISQEGLSTLVDSSLKIWGAKY